MKKLKKGIVAIVCFVLGVTMLSGCGNLIVTELVYPDYQLASADSDSWTQWKDYDDNVIEIDWYVDLTTWSVNSATEISQVILEETGVKINFQAPTTSDGSKLSTMISGNQLTDVISIAANTSDRMKLSEEVGYIYPIQELASRWAPTLNERLEEEMVSMYKASDGNIYGIPNHFYSTEDVNSFSEMGGQLLSNGGIIARKDYLDAYHAYMYANDPSFDPSSVATPSGILKMALWVKSEYNLDASNPTVCLAPFESHRTTGSVGIRWLMEYFSVMEEDSNGDYVYQYESQEFEDMMLWLNELYTNKLMTTGNFTATSSQIGTYLQQGLPFIYIGSPQDYASNIKNWGMNRDGQEYVPIVFGNEDGDVPQLAVTGNSYMYSMITTNCERPDRVIKLFDYLYSEEGQRLIAFGTEAESASSEDGTFYYTVEPGTTATLDNGNEYTYKYGQIDYTDKVKEDFNNNSYSGYGFFSPNILISPMYNYLTSVNQGTFNTYVNYVTYNSKAALIPFTYSYRGFEFELDATSDNYDDMISIETNLRLLWNEYYAMIICSSSASEAKSVLDSTLAQAVRKGYEEYITYKNTVFQAHKENMGITYASPINDPTSDYSSLKIESVYGDTSYVKEVPDTITIQ